MYKGIIVSKANQLSIHIKTIPENSGLILSSCLTKIGWKLRHLLVKFAHVSKTITQHIYNENLSSYQQSS
jgi:hypothetical protein